MWAPAWMAGAVGSHFTSWMEAGCITGCGDPRVGDRAQLLLTSGRPLPRRHASPGSGVPAGHLSQRHRGSTRPSCVQAATSPSLVVLGPHSLHGHRVSGGLTDYSGRVTPEVPSTPEKTGVILNGLPAFYARILLLGAFCCHGYTQKAPTIQASVLIRELLKSPGLCSRPAQGSPRSAVSGALSSSSLSGGRPRETVCLLPAGGFIPETLQALGGRVDESVEQ